MKERKKKQKQKEKKRKQNTFFLFLVVVLRQNVFAVFTLGRQTHTLTHTRMINFVFVLFCFVSFCFVFFFFCLDHSFVNFVFNCKMLP